MSAESTLITELDLLEALDRFDNAHGKAWTVFVDYKFGDASEREVNDANRIEHQRRNEMRDLLRRVAEQIGGTR